MPLVEIGTFRDLLVCPRCGSSLSGRIELLVCSNDSCGVEYTALGDPPIPVLIDSDSSIVNVASLLKTDAVSQIDRERQGRLRELVKRRIAPQNRAAEHHVHRLAEDLVAETRGRPRVLIIGGGEVGSGIEGLYEDPNIDLLAFDIYSNDNCQFLADGHRVPLKSGSLDGVVIQAVLEHVLDPQSVVDEIYRVLRPGGLVYADTPFMQQVHEGPYDFTRFTASGHRYLFRRFAVRNSGAAAGLGTQLFWSLIYFGRGVNYRIGQMLRVALFWLPRLDRWLDARVTIDGASSTFFYGHSSPISITPADIVNYYSGAQTSSIEP